MRPLEYTRPHHLPKLHGELQAAPSWRPENSVRSDGTTIFLTVDDATVDAQIDAIVNAHDPTPVNQTDHQTRRVFRTTTDATVTEIARITVPPNSVATYFVQVFAVSGTNVLSTSFRVTGKRAAGNAALVGTPTVAHRQGDAATSTWQGSVVADGPDLVLRVTGAAGVTITWSVDAEVDSYAP